MFVVTLASHTSLNGTVGYLSFIGKVECYLLCMPLSFSIKISVDAFSESIFRKNQYSSKACVGGLFTFERGMCGDCPPLFRSVLYTFITVLLCVVWNDPLHKYAIGPVDGHNLQDG